jgi:putative transposase
MVIAIPPQ